MNQGKQDWKSFARTTLGADISLIWPLKTGTLYLGRKISLW